MRVYADSETLAAYPGGETIPETSRPTLLRLASRVVDQLLIGHIYDTDAEGYPTDPDHRQALADACCAIAVEAHATGATLAGATTDWESVGIGSVSLSGRKHAEDTRTVFGVPVPSAALIALADVGTFMVVVR